MRLRYTDWRNAIEEVGRLLRASGVLRRVAITAELPPAEPWRRRGGD